MAVVSSYSTLLTEVQNTLVRSDLSTFAPNYVQRWEERFLRDPANFGSWMEVSGTIGTIAAAVIAVPAAYRALKYAYVNGSPSTPLVRVSIDQMYGTYPRGGTTGLPIWIARDGTNFVFGPEPDSAYVVKGVYWAKPTVLRSYTTGGADAVAHWIIVNAPDLAVYGSVLEAVAEMRDDPRVAMWKMAYGYALDAYRDLMRDENTSGSPVFEVLA